MKIERITAISAAALIAAQGAFAADPELVVFDWAGYEDPEFYKAYLEEHSAPPTYSFFGDEEEAFQKLRAGFRADLAHPCSQSVVKWREAGLLKPIDTSRIPEWENVMAEFKAMEGFMEDGKAWIVPLDWGATGLVYRTDEVPAEDAATLQSFISPKYEGRVSLPDNVDDAYALGFLATGVKDWTKATDAEFEAASDFLRRAHANTRAYWQDNSQLSQLIASGEVLLAWAWNETPTTMQAEGHPVAMNRAAKEGSSTWVCGYVKLEGGEGSEDKAYDFINAWLEPRTADYIVNAWGYGHSNAKAMGELDPEALKAAGFDDFASYADSTLWQSPLPAPLREKMIAEFERIKAGF